MYYHCLSVVHSRFGSSIHFGRIKRNYIKLFFYTHPTFAQNNYNANFLSLAYFCRIVIIQ